MSLPSLGTAVISVQLAASESPTSISMSLGTRLAAWRASASLRPATKGVSTAIGAIANVPVQTNTGARSFFPSSGNKSTFGRASVKVGSEEGVLRKSGCQGLCGICTNWMTCAELASPKGDRLRSECTAAEDASRTLFLVRWPDAVCSEACNMQTTVKGHTAAPEELGRAAMLQSAGSIKSEAPPPGRLLLLPLAMLAAARLGGSPDAEDV